MAAEATGGPTSHIEGGIAVTGCLVLGMGWGRGDGGDHEKGFKGWGGRY